MTIGKTCNTEAVTINENATIKEATKLMADKDIGFLVVTSEDKAQPTGIITDRDIVIKVIAKDKDPSESRVSEIMSADLLILEANQGINEIIESMSKKGIRRAPIVSEGKVTGAVSVDELFIMLSKELNTLAQIPREQNP